MKYLTIKLIVITLASIASTSCSSMEDTVIQNPLISNLVLSAIKPDFFQAFVVYTPGFTPKSCKGDKKCLYRANREL